MSSAIVYKLDGTETYGLFLWEYSPASIVKIGDRTIFLENDTRLVMLFTDVDCKEPVLLNGKAQAKAVSKDSLTFIKYISDVNISAAVGEDA